jgi:3-methyladenine DNA glycosylase/8-oxoguanine DNA glycosylase
MARALSIALPGHFNFRSTVYSHGWCELAPFELDEEKWRLTYVFAGVKATIYEKDRRLRIEVEGEAFDKKRLLRDVRHILRLDDDLEGLYGSIAGHERLAWVAEKGAGRLLRSPTVFEDLVKTICTTNCSWALTKSMVANLVNTLGAVSADGRRAFPSAEAMAAMNEKFYRDEIRAGYRSPYFVELAEAVASGKLDPEAWLASDLPTAELKKEMKNVKGVGDYAAENLLKLVGRYDGLALDSWLRSQFYKNHNKQKACPDKKIERHYKKFGKWRGLVIWCDMTEKWIN